MRRSFPIAFLFALASSAAYAQAIPYDDVSFFEEPNSWELPGGTLTTNVALDQTVWYNNETDKTNHQTEVLGRARFEGQLPNTVRVGVEYFGHYFRRGRLRYSDQVQFFAADDWGTVAVGHVSLAVRQDLRRPRGIGHAELFADDFYSGLDQDALYYRYNHRAYTASAVVDREGGFEVGALYERPVEDAVYKYGVRFRRGDTTDRDPTDGVPNAIQMQRDPAKGYGGALVGEYTYGSWNFGWQGGYEYLSLNRSPDDAHRFFNSAGINYKIGAVAMSVEGLAGTYDGDSEYSAAVGVDWTVARGADILVGYNWSEYQNFKNSQAFLTFCYSF